MHNNSKNMSLAQTNNNFKVLNIKQEPQRNTIDIGNISNSTFYKNYKSIDGMNTTVQQNREYSNEQTLDLHNNSKSQVKQPNLKSQNNFHSKKNNFVKQKKQQDGDDVLNYLNSEKK